eukprot:gene10780-10934_t
MDLQHRRVVREQRRPVELWQRSVALTGQLLHARRYTYPKVWTPGMAYAKHFPAPPAEKEQH